MFLDQYYLSDLYCTCLNDTLNQKIITDMKINYQLNESVQLWKQSINHTVVFIYYSQMLQENKTDTIKTITIQTVTI